MREDMDEIVIERPRWGHWLHYPRGELKQAYARSWEDAPVRESYGARYRQKSLSDNLAPLCRFLRSRVGQPWNGVFSEIASRINVDSAVQKHIRDHLEDFVFVRTWREGGALWAAGHRRHGQPFCLDRESWWGGRFYVCPDTGFLRELGSRTVSPDHRRTQQVRSLSPYVQLRRIDGRWHLLELSLIPSGALEREQCLDAFLKRPVLSVEKAERRRLYGRDEAYCAVMRPLTKREKARYLGGR